jgi:hypothetical protein
MLKIINTIAFVVMGLTALACSTALAQGTAPVPTKLFGIELGSVLDVNSDKSISPAQIPAKAFRGMTNTLGHGAHYYFEPITVNPSLPYKEEKTTPSDDFYKTSYRLYILPIAPKGAKTIEEFGKAIMRWEVLAINWEELEVQRNAYSRDSKEEKEARRSDYWWALSLCKTFTAEFVVKPEIVDVFDSYLYVCRFTQSDRTLEVSSSYQKSLSLALRRDLADKKNQDFDTAVRQLQAREILK